MPGLAPARLLISAGETKIVNARGSLCFLRRVLDGIPTEYGGTGVDANQDVLVTLPVRDEGEAYAVRMAASEKIRASSEFYRVEIENPQAAALWVEFYIGFGDFVRPVPDIINVAVNKANSNAAQTIADNTITTAEEIFDPANYPGFVEAWVGALAANDQILRIGDSNVATNRGQELAAGDSLIWKSKEPCYAVEAVAGTNAVSVVIFTES